MAQDDYSADVSTGGLLVVGQSASGSLESGGDRDWFKVYLTAGTSYYFTLEGGDQGAGGLRDPHLYLYDSSGASITDNDDSGGKLGSRIVYTASSSGYYYLGAGSYKDGQTGTYSVAAGSYENEYSSRTPGSLSEGGSLSGELQVLGDVDWVKVELVAGTRYTIRLQGKDSGQGTLADPYVYLYDSSGKVIASDDDGSGRRDSVITYTPTTGGTFYLGLAAYQNGSTGTYTASLSGEVLPDDFSAGIDSAGRVSVGGSVSGELERHGDRDWFAVEMEAGEVYYFDLKGASTGAGSLSDSYLYLYDASGNRIAFNDDGGQGLNSRIVFSATASGTYYLGAAGFDDKQTGTYSLSVGKLPDSQHSGEGRITSYGTREGSLGAGEHEWVSLALEAATTYLIVLEENGDDSLADPTLDLRDTNGASVAAGLSTDASGSRSLSFTTNEAGNYYVDIGASGENDAGKYLLSIVGRQVDQFNQAAGTGDWSATNLLDSSNATSPGLASGVTYSSQTGQSAAAETGQAASSLTSTSGQSAGATLATKS